MRAEGLGNFNSVSYTQKIFLVSDHILGQLLRFIALSSAVIAFCGTCHHCGVGVIFLYQNYMVYAFKTKSLILGDYLENL
jgi:hypothetical protein